jgi:hypothetical protein
MHFSFPLSRNIIHLSSLGPMFLSLFEHFWRFQGKALASCKCGQPPLAQ